MVAAGRDVEMSRSGSLLTASGRDFNFSNGISQVIVVGNQLKMTNVSAVGMKIGGNAEMANSSTVFSVSGQTQAKNSSIGVVLAGKVELGEGTRVLMNTRRQPRLGPPLGPCLPC